MAILEQARGLRAHRRTIRATAAAVAAITGVLYLLIGVGVLDVVEATSPDAPSLLEFGLLAGGAYLLGALLLAVVDRRVLWIIGAFLQVGVIVMYLAVGTQRTPSFEVWGLTIKAMQAFLLGALLCLAIWPAEPRTRDAG